MGPEPEADCSELTDSGCEREQSELGSIHGPVKELLHLQEGSAPGLTYFPGAQEATCHKQGDSTCERAANEDVENGICSSDGRVREPLDPQGTSATGHGHRSILSKLAGECRATPVASREGQCHWQGQGWQVCGCFPMCGRGLVLRSAPAVAGSGSRSCPQGCAALLLQPVPSPLSLAVPTAVSLPVARLLALWLPAEGGANRLRAPPVLPGHWVGMRGPDLVFPKLHFHSALLPVTLAKGTQGTCLHRVKPFFFYVFLTYTLLPILSPLFLPLEVLSELPHSLPAWDFSSSAWWFGDKPNHSIYCVWSASV
ncbi:uncharacterized protein LOC130255211 [Oenanthe melanoleuca]|uniref:uncharacterized protein LOC130255211 n=1 Tax=Oenanthe melanoleuca TaxID=2939378 RepID=UPI0024C1B598|nr:uncharacterized protein LOC130255211 [Oenanthe melanoleuca]